MEKFIEDPLISLIAKNNPREVWGVKWEIMRDGIDL